MLLSTRLDQIDEAYSTPDLSDLFMYEAISNEDGEVMPIDTGDIITIQCVDGIYRTGEVYSYGLTYTRIIVNNRFYTAVITDDVQLNLRTAENQYAENMHNIIQFVQEVQNAPKQSLQGAAS